MSEILIPRANITVSKTERELKRRRLNRIKNTVIDEELTPEQAAEVRTWERDPKAIAVTDHFFGGPDIHEKIEDLETSENKSEVHKNIEDHLGTDISIDDYKQGKTKDKYGRDAKIGKLLAASKAPPHLVNGFANDPTRQGKSISRLRVLTTRSPEGVAGQTSGSQSWIDQSCKNIVKGINRHYLPREVRNGTVVSYLIDKDNRELGRITHQPHINDEGNIIYAVDANYGIDTQDFKDHADNISKKLSMPHTGNPIYKKHPEVYNDNGIRTLIHPDTNHEKIRELYNNDNIIRDTIIKYSNNLPDDIFEDAMKSNSDLLFHNSNLSADKIEKLYNNHMKNETPSPYKISYLLKNKNVPSHILYDIITNPKLEKPENFLSRVYNHKNINQDHINYGINNADMVHSVALASSQRLRPHNIDALLDMNGAYINSILSKNNRLTPNHIDRFIDNENHDSSVEENIGKHLNLSEKNQTRILNMSDDKNSSYMRGLAQNPNIKPKILDSYIEKSKSLINDHVLMVTNPQIKPEHIGKIFKKHNYNDDVLSRALDGSDDPTERAEYRNINFNLIPSEAISGILEHNPNPDYLYNIISKSKNFNEEHTDKIFSGDLYKNNTRYHDDDLRNIKINAINVIPHMIKDKHIDKIFDGSDGWLMSNAIDKGLAKQKHIDKILNNNDDNIYGTLFTAKISALNSPYLKQEHVDNIFNKNNDNYNTYKDHLIKNQNDKVNVGHLNKFLNEQLLNKNARNFESINNILSHKNADASTIGIAMNTDSRVVRTAAASSDKISDDDLYKAINDKNIDVLNSALNNPKLKYEHILKIIHDDHKKEDINNTNDNASRPFNIMDRSKELYSVIEPDKWRHILDLASNHKQTLYNAYAAYEQDISPENMKTLLSKNDEDGDVYGVSATAAENLGKNISLMHNKELHDFIMNPNIPISEKHHNVLKEKYFKAANIATDDGDNIINNIGLGIKDSNKNIRIAALSNPYANSTHIQHGLDSNEIELKRAAVFHRNISDSQIDDVMKNEKDEDIIKNLVYNNVSYKSKPEHIDRAINEFSDDTLNKILRNTGYQHKGDIINKDHIDNIINRVNKTGNTDLYSTLSEHDKIKNVLTPDHIDIMTNALNNANKSNYYSILNLLQSKKTSSKNITNVIAFNDKNIDTSLVRTPRIPLNSSHIHSLISKNHMTYDGIDNLLNNHIDTNGDNSHIDAIIDNFNNYQDPGSNHVRKKILSSALSQRLNDDSIDKIIKNKDTLSIFKDDLYITRRKPLKSEHINTLLSHEIDNLNKTGNKEGVEGINNLFYRQKIDNTHLDNIIDNVKNPNNINLLLDNNKIEEALNDEHIHKLIDKSSRDITNKLVNAPMTRSPIKLNLDHLDKIVRDKNLPDQTRIGVFRLHKYKINDKIIDSAFDTGNDRVLSGLLNIDDIKFNNNHIDRGLDHENKDVRSAAAIHASANEDHINRALDDVNETVRNYAIHNKNATKNNISKALEDSYYYNRIDAIRHKKFDIDHANKIVDMPYQNNNRKDEYISNLKLKLIELRSDLLNDSHIDKLLRDYNVNHELVNSPKVTKKHLDKLFSSNDYNDDDDVMKENALNENPNITPDHINKALESDNDYIKRAAIKNKNASKENLDKAILDKDHSIRSVIASNPNVTLEHLDKLINDKSNLVKASVLNSPKATKDHLLKLISDTDNPHIQESDKIFEHPNIDEDHITQALKLPSWNSMIKFHALEHPKLNKSHIQLVLNNKDEDKDIKNFASLKQFNNKSLQESFKFRSVWLNKLLMEELTPEQTKEVRTWERDPKAISATDHFFGVGNEVRIDHLETNNTKSEIHREIENHLGNEIDISDYRDGKTKDKYGRDAKIGGLLVKSKAPQHLINGFANDHSRQGKSIKGLRVLTTRSPEGVAGQTSGSQSWIDQSCKNYETGLYKSKLPHEVKNGTVVSYLIDQNNKEISRVTYQPHINDEGNTIYKSDRHIYGVEHKDFMDYTDELESHLSQPHKGSLLYTKHPDVYDETGQSFAIHPDFTDKDIEREYNNPDTDITEKRALLSHKNTPDSVIDDVLKSQNKINIFANNIAKNPSLKNETIKKIISSKDLSNFSKSDFLSHKNLSGDDVIDILNDGIIDQHHVYTIRENPNLSKKHITDIFNMNSNIYGPFQDYMLGHHKVDSSHIQQALNSNNNSLIRSAVQNKKITSEQIDNILKTDDIRIKESLAYNKNLNSNHIDKLLDLNNVYVNNALAENPSLKENHINKLLHNENSSVRNNVLTHANISNDIIHSFIDNHPDTHEYISQNKNINSDHIHKLIDKSTKDNMRRTLTSKNINSDHISKMIDLAGDNKAHSIYLLSDILDHPKVNEDHLEKILRNGDNNFSEYIREKALQNPKINKKHIDIALNDPNASIRIEAVRHKFATPEHIDKALDDDTLSVRNAAIKNKNASKENLDKALFGENQRLITITNALKNPNLTNDHITKVIDTYNDHSGEGIIHDLINYNEYKLTPDHIDKLLNNSSNRIRSYVIKNYNANKDNITKALYDSTSSRVRENAMSHQNFDESHANKILNDDKLKNLRYDLFDRIDVITPKHIDMALKGDDDDVAVKAISSPNTNSKNIMNALDHSDYQVRMAAIKHGKAISKEHLDKAINDSNPKVRQQVLNHSLATRQHFEKGLNDTDLTNHTIAFNRLKTMTIGEQYEKPKNNNLIKKILNL